MILKTGQLLVILIGLQLIAAESGIEKNNAEALYEETSTSDGPKIYYMRVSTNVSNRFATTLITCRMKNPSVVAKEATFSIILPNKAFISNFAMEINNVTYPAYVKEKKEAQQIYDQAVDQGQAAAQVKVNARNSKRFSVNINLEAEDRAVFYLTYEELLVRSNGKYDIVLNIYPGQPVKNLLMEVKINETQPLKFVKSPILKPSSRLDAKELVADAIVENLNTSSYVKYTPDIYEQKRIARSLETGEKYGLAAQFVVQYDVQRRSPGGQIIQTRNNFVQYFAPEDVPSIPKYVIFILDTSGSMLGLKLDQLKEALKNILLKLRPEDSFNIIDFAEEAKVWDVTKGDITYVENFLNQYGFGNLEFDKKNNRLPPAHQATKENIEKALGIVNLLDTIGVTDIFTPLNIGFKLMRQNFQNINNTQPIIIFITDGVANFGLIDSKMIVENITSTNVNHTGIYSLSLGSEVNRDFLNDLSSKNFGHTTHIYEETDMALQIQKFFDNLASPALKNVTFNFVPNVAKLSKKVFSTAFKGSELVVVGEKTENTDLSKFPLPSISAQGNSGAVKLIPDVETATQNMERLWAYVRVRQLLEQRKLVEDNTDITKRALNLALKYSFVTDITSLVVVKPAGNDTVDPKDADLEEDYSEFGGATTSKPQVYGYVVPSVPPVPSTIILPTSNRPTTNIPHITVTWSTTKSTEVPLTEEESSRLELLKEKIPWLQYVVSDSGAILLATETLPLDLSSNTENPESCTYTFNRVNGTGKCVRFHECVKRLPDLNIFSTFRKHLCPLQNKWGMCCH